MDVSCLKVTSLLDAEEEEYKGENGKKSKIRRRRSSI